MRIVGVLVFFLVVGNVGAERPSVAEVAEKNSAFLQSGETEAKLEKLKAMIPRERDDAERRENQVMEELAKEITSTFQELKEIDTTLADPKFFDFDTLHNVAEIDRKIHTLARAKEFNQTILTEAYWKKLLRGELKKNGVAAARIDSIISSFMKGMGEGLQQRTKQLGLETKKDIEDYRHAIVSEHTIAINILTLLKREFGKWKVKGDTMEFSRPDAAKEYAALYQKLEALPK